jgi:hypothetical protein
MSDNRSTENIVALQTAKEAIESVMNTLPARPSRLKLTKQLGDILEDVNMVLNSLEQPPTTTSFTPSFAPGLNA